MHRQRLRKYGSLDLPDPKTTEERFWDRVSRADDESCWEWIGARDERGYGRLGHGGRGTGFSYAHRLSYEINVGPIPTGLTIDHLCRNTSCVNPRHLEPVSLEENIRRAKRYRTHCIHGHEFTPENTYWRKEGRRQCIQCQHDRREAA